MLLKQIFTKRLTKDSHSCSNGNTATNKEIEAAFDLMVRQMQYIAADLRYRSKLKDSMAATLEHLKTLVNRLPEPDVDLSPDRYNEDTRFKLLFSNSRRIPEIVNQGPGMRKFFEGSANSSCYAVLWARLVSRQKLTVALEGDSLQKDVLKTQHGFSGHNILFHSENLDGTRNRLQEHLLKLFLAEMSVSINTEIEELIRKTFSTYGRRNRDAVLPKVREFLERASSCVSLDDFGLLVDPRGFELSEKEAQGKATVPFQRIYTTREELGIPVMVVVPKHVVDMEKSHDFNHTLAARMFPS